jgi:hypothetical protein
MRHIFSIFLIFLIFVPFSVFAGMTQQDLDSLYTKPIVLDNKHYTFDIELPVDSTDGYRWFLIPPDYDYIDDGGYTHESVDIKNSKWGGMDNFKLKLTKKFRKVPHKIILHFECLRPFEENPQILKKDIVVLSLVD